jgi:hypothetical protein
LTTLCLVVRTVSKGRFAGASGSPSATGPVLAVRGYDEVTT